ncbi:MAG TPA: ABC transporter permease [Verrucomicrobiae bacterium]|nr:ABC transporter permease [Verrucomicrobiae bacterium]
MSTKSEANYFLLPALTLWWREMVRFFRQTNRIVGALGTPLVFWLLLGSGLGKSFSAPSAPSGHGYLEYFFGGTIVLVLLFTAIFSTISIIEDRREGFLQAVLVAPVGRFALVLGKILGGTSLALIQGLMFLLLAPFVGISFSIASVIWLVVVMFLLSFALTGLGFLLAWRMDSTQGFHAIMNLFLIPLWLLSGAVFPPSGAPSIMRWIMVCNPVSYGVIAIRHGLYWNTPLATTGMPSREISLLVTVVFAVVMFLLSWLAAQRTTRGDLQ